MNDGASVVFLSSNVATTSKPNSSIYQASKAALNSIAKTAAAELAPRKIRVNLVSPEPNFLECKCWNLEKNPALSIDIHQLPNVSIFNISSASKVVIPLF